MTDLRKLFREALAEDAPDLSLSDAAVEESWRSIIAQAEAQRWQAALGTIAEPRREGWLAGVEAALEVVIGKVRGTSRIVTAAARELLPLAPDAWSFAAAPVTRGGPAVARADATRGTAQRTVFVDEGAEPPRIVALFRNHPPEEPIPEMLVVAAQGGFALEVSPTVTEERGLPRHLTLRYETEVPPMPYHVFFGNPRSE